MLICLSFETIRLVKVHILDLFENAKLLNGDEMQMNINCKQHSAISSGDFISCTHAGGEENN